VLLKSVIEAKNESEAGASGGDTRRRRAHATSPFMPLVMKAPLKREKLNYGFFMFWDPHVKTS